ncbi:MAG: hypothetical protein QOF14_2970 [Hyphomicrobiales bacterium]|nr:hypothetical protein [Hyphomicrobiales bacterium]
MLIVCPTCATSYQIGLTAVGAAGRSVRCAHCKNTWFATPDSVVEEPALVSVPALQHAPAPVDDFAGMDARPLQEVLPPGDAGADNPFTFADAPPLVPHDHPATEAEATKFDPGVPDDAETIAARRVRQTYVDRKDRRPLLRRLVSMPMLIVAMAAILLGALNWRAAVVRHFPQTASLYAAIGLPVNLRGLFFEDVKSRSELHDGVMVLIVEGTIVNLTTRTLEVPRLRLSLRNGVGHEVYAWTALPSKSTLGSGNGLPFRARLASPPPDGRDVIVRFFNRRDALAGPL